MKITLSWRHISGIYISGNEKKRTVARRVIEAKKWQGQKSSHGKRVNGKKVAVARVVWAPEWQWQISGSGIRGARAEEWQWLKPLLLRV